MISAMFGLEETIVRFTHSKWLVIDMILHLYLWFTAMGREVYNFVPYIRQ